MKPRTVLSLALFGAVLITPAAERPRGGPSVDLRHGDLKVVKNNRFLVHADGTPFFWLGDTAWELFHRLDREGAERYLENRRQKGFTVIQAVALAELDGLNTANAYGHKPLNDNDPKRPNEEYFTHVDFIVDMAENKGIFIGMLPTWGDKVTKAWGKGPVVFNREEEAYVYGQFLGQRYRKKPNIVWILGGDRGANRREHIWRAMARGITEGDDDRHLKTYHPPGSQSSATWFHRDAWLDFNMLQSGHAHFDNANYRMVAEDYSRKPSKPCLDGEPRYENHPVKWKPNKGWFMDFDARQAAYWALFAGAFGHTYGCHDIWQMAAPGRIPVSSARHAWYEVLDLPGAWDMMHVRHLMESRPFLSRIPDQSLIVSGQQEKGRHIQATRGQDYIFIYTPYGDTFSVMLGTISGSRVRVWWFDPRTGKAKQAGEIDNKGVHTFDPPGESRRGNDWVLVLDDASKRFPAPGRDN